MSRAVRPRQWVIPVASGPVEAAGGEVGGGRGADLDARRLPPDVPGQATMTTWWSGDAGPRSRPGTPATPVADGSREVMPGSHTIPDIGPMSG
ncbi:hypothetical protein GCM10018952_61040 [Streptosporangium vulgare]